MWPFDCTAQISVTVIGEIFYNESFFMDGWGELKLKKLAKVKHATQQILQYQN